MAAPICAGVLAVISFGGELAGLTGCAGMRAELEGAVAASSPCYLSRGGVLAETFGGVQ